MIWAGTGVVLGRRAASVHHRLHTVVALRPIAVSVAVAVVIVVIVTVGGGIIVVVVVASATVKDRVVGLVHGLAGGEVVAAPVGRVAAATRH